MSREFCKMVDGVVLPVNVVQHIPDEHTTCPLAYACGCSGVLYVFFKPGALPPSVAARLAEEKARAEAGDCGRHDASRVARLRFFAGQAGQKDEPEPTPSPAEVEPEATGSPLAEAWSKAERRKQARRAEAQTAHSKWKAEQSAARAAAAAVAPQEAFSRRRPEGGKPTKAPRPRRN